MTGIRRAHALFLGLALAAAARGQDDGSPPESAADRRARVESLQARAKELMGELEDRMFQLSQSLRDAQPDDAARIVLALQRAREELILEEMSAIEHALEGGDLDAVEEQQRAVLRRLESLRELLLSTDLDLLLKLERLRKLSSALARLEELERESERLEEELEELAEEAAQGERGEGAPSEPTAAEQRRMKGEQLAAQEAREEAEMLEGDVSEAAGAQSEATEGVRQAAQEMRETEEKLEEGDTGGASEAQSQASESLSKAKSSLRREREELLWELQPHLRRKVIDALVQMRDELERVAEGLSETVGDSTARVTLAGDGARRMGERMRIVEDLGREARLLVLDTEFSVHLGALLEWTDLRLEVPERGFEASLAGPEEVAATRRVQGVLDELVKVLLEEDQRWQGARGDDSRRKLIKLVSELKGCRALQRVLREDTTAVDESRAGAGLAPALEEELDALHDLEAGMPAMMLVLDERYWAEVAGAAGDD